VAAVKDEPSLFFLGLVVGMIYMAIGGTLISTWWAADAAYCEGQSAARVRVCESRPSGCHCERLDGSWANVGSLGG
jgi:hypothetical protein